MPPGHFNALFTQDATLIAKADTWQKMLEVAADQGCFLIWNHPGWQAPQNGGIEKGAPLRFTDAHEDVRKRGWMHGIEIFNSTECYPIVSDWCNERDLAIFANSDIHASELNHYGIRTLHDRSPWYWPGEERREVREALFAKGQLPGANMIWGATLVTETLQGLGNDENDHSGTIELTNISSLPITVSIGGGAVQLNQNIAQMVYRAKA